MKNTILSLILCGLPFTSYAQVDNYCLRLSPEGQVDCGSMPELNHADSYTLQFWMYADKWTSGSAVLSRGSALSVRLDKAQDLRFVLGNETFSLNDKMICPDQWFQVTAIVDKGNVKVLINQKQIYEAKGDFGLPQEESPFIIGDKFTGRVDEVRIWKNALRPDFDYFVHNTLNKWTPQLDDLVAYYKFDQEQCPDIVDYKALFVPESEFNHHGKVSSSGAQRETVKDNDGLPYLINGAYTNNSRFFDRAIARDNYLLSNDLIILGIDSYPDGHLKACSPNDHGTLKGDARYLDRFEGREGVISFGGNGSMTTTADVLCPRIGANGTAGKGYTFETWMYLDQWTPGAVIFKKMTDDGKGFSITLGEEETHQVIVNVNGNRYVNLSPLRTGKWTHFAVTTNQGSSPRLTFLFAYDGKAQWAKTSLSTDKTDYTPVGNENCKAIIGEGLCGKLDETVIWNEKYNIDALRNHISYIPFPGIGKEVTAETIDNGSAYYRYDRKENPGWDSFSQDEWKDIMLSAYQGYRGYQVRISVKGHEGWQSTIANAQKRKIFAADLAELSEGYDGVELDLEWMDGTQTNLGKLAQEIRKALPKEKTLKISCHAYGAYKFPLSDMEAVDGFTFQLYGPQKTWYDLSSYKQSYNRFLNYGFPKEKIYMSYSTTTSAPYDSNDRQQGIVITGWRSILKFQDYEPSEDMGLRKGHLGGNVSYYYMSPEQVYQKAKFAAENSLQGIFYWDMGNDVDASEAYSLAKYCSYALNSNVDTLVTEVQILHPTSIQDIVKEDKGCKLKYNPTDSQLTIQSDCEIKKLNIYSMNGTLMTYTDGPCINVNRLPKGLYVIQPVSDDRLLSGIIFSKTN